MAELNPTGVYRPPLWADVAGLFTGLHRVDAESVWSYLKARADRLLIGWLDRSPGATDIVASWHPVLVGDRAAIDAHGPDADDARAVVAAEHGFARWGHVEAAADRRFHPAFERAVDDALAGRIEPLSTAVADEPALLAARSPFDHRATLLHYLAANGVETERQVTPLNAAEVIDALVAAGADVSAEMTVYGGRFTTLQLVETSAHPRDAGVLQAMVAALTETAV